MDTTKDEIVPKSDIEVLNQQIDDEDGLYRVRAQRRVHYLRIPTTVFPEMTMCRPYLLIPELPDLPATDWTVMDVSRTPEGALEAKLSFELLPAVRALWHPNSVDVLSLPRTRMYRSAVCEVIYQGRPAISKIACFDWNMPQMNRETWAYSILDDHYQQHHDAPRIAPEFLAHLTENGRVIGMLLEKIDGDFASIDDIAECESVLRKVHSMGLVHGDVNRYNFVVDTATRSVRMVDFEHAEEFEEETARVEVASLSDELAEEGRRGRASPINLPASFGKLLQ